MNERENVAIVKQIYAAYGQGNIPAILAAMTEDVAHDEPAAGAPPYRGTYRGREDIRSFFQRAFETVEVEAFEPKEFIAEGDRVVVLGNYRFRAKATNRSYETEWAMVWRLKDRKVTGWTTYKDSAAEAAALGTA